MSSGSDTGGSRVRGLRGNTFAAIVMLLVQYGLGIAVNLYSTLPASDRGKSTFGSYESAVGNGPLLLSLHAVLGTLLLITASAAVIRAIRLTGARYVIPTAVALTAILTAWVAGARFVGDMKNGASLAMALATAVAILCYALVILLLGLRDDGLRGGDLSPTSSSRNA